ncbi:hypothetical protein ACVGXF_05955, partial [Enterobacter hormaechei]
AFVLAFFMSGGGQSLNHQTLVKFFMPGKAHPPPRQFLKPLHHTNNKQSHININHPTTPGLTNGFASFG